MEIVTRDYGTVDIDESSVIRFDDGIIGFEGYHDYVLLDDSSGESPFRCLQSLEESSLAFILLDPFAVKPDYEISLDDGVTAELEIAGGEDVVILAIVVVPEDITKMSFNLKAPIVVNGRLRKGVQYIVDSNEYKVRHSVMEEIENTKKRGRRRENGGSSGKVGKVGSGGSQGGKVGSGGGRTIEIGRGNGAPGQRQDRMQGQRQGVGTAEAEPASFIGTH
jgi:flagellar assembly factor FliW